MKTILTTLNSQFVHSNLALRYLREQARHDGIAVELLEYTINTRNELIIRDLVARAPDVVAFSVYIWNVQPTLALIADLKKYLPQCSIVVGGPEVSYAVQELLLANPALDFVLAGEIVGQFSQLLTALQTQTDYRGIANLGYRNDTNIVINACEPLESNLTAIFPYNDSDFLQTNQIIYYESSRGCPYNCSYCLSAAGRGVRFRDPDVVIGELQWLIDRSPKQIKFVDRTFNVNPAHYLPILHFLSRVDSTANFHFEIVGELITDEFLEIVAAAPVGRFQFEAGLQSFNPPTLSAINRNNNYALSCERFSKLQANNNSHLHIDLIAGLPYEGYKEFARSFDLAYAIQSDMLQLGFLKLLNGTPLYREVAQHGYVFQTLPPYTVIANNYISAEELLRLKSLEEVLEIFTNSGRAKRSLEYLRQQAGSAFAVFQAIGDYWRAERLYLQPHKPEKLYKHLLTAVQEKFAAHSEKFAQLLKKDVYCLEKTLLAKNELWFDNNEFRSQKDQLLRNEQLREIYCPGFKMDSWRNLRNNFEIGIFCLDERYRALLFDYRTQPVTVREIAEEHFGEICATTNIQAS
ncbi:MAG: DUF4080 domain-containing protein [Bacillota bacterium]